MALADGHAGGGEDDSADARVGAGRAETGRGERDGTAHRRLELFGGVAHPSAPLSAIAVNPVIARTGQEFGGVHARRDDCARMGATPRPDDRAPRQAATDARALSPIRTLTVGPGVSPGPPPTSGRRRVAGLPSVVGAAGSPPVRSFTDPASAWWVLSSSLPRSRSARIRVNSGEPRHTPLITPAGVGTGAMPSARLRRSRLQGAAVDRDVRAGLGLGHRLHLGRGGHDLAGGRVGPVRRQGDADGDRDQVGTLHLARAGRPSRRSRGRGRTGS